MVHHTAVSLMGSSTLSAVHTTRVVVIVTPPPPGQQIIVMCMSVCPQAYLRNYTSNLHPIFTARPYASAVYAVVVRPSVHHKSRYVSKLPTNRAGFGMEAAFHLSHTVF